MQTIDPQLQEFINFCVERRGKEWPAIYDEIARVAALRLYKGLGYSELKRLGLSLAASDLDRLMQLVNRVADCKGNIPLSS
jgi:hypothetical protein